MIKLPLCLRAYIHQYRRWVFQQKIGDVMSTQMDGIVQRDLFSGAMRMDVVIGAEDRYRILTEILPWIILAEVVNRYRALKVDIDDGRPLNLRLHLGAIIAQGMNGWTDRELEEMIAYHAGVRFLCGLVQSSETLDHTSHIKFRNQVGPDGIKEINTIAIRTAREAGFTDSTLCSADTTVQESPIAYPTEVGHLKNIAEKLGVIGTRIKQGLKESLESILEKVGKVHAQIRLFTRGKTQKAIEKKKRLTRKLHSLVRRMLYQVEQASGKLTAKSRAQYEERLIRYRLMLVQIWQWVRTGYHPNGKLLSLWHTEARAITRDKAGKKTEFGRRWVISRLTQGYLTGAVCSIGADNDLKIVPAVLADFKAVTGELPEMVVYDRGGDSTVNHDSLKESGVRYNGIFRKGRKSLRDLSPRRMAMARRERPLSEAGIATIKCRRYGFTKPRAKSVDSCILKGHLAILGANLNHLARDFAGALS